MTHASLLAELQDDGKLAWALDYEACEPDEEAAADTLDAWFRSPAWRGSGHRFVQIGQDGTGSLYCLWFYPGLVGEPPVIFFGSEGETDLVADSAADLARALASGFEWWPYERAWNPAEEEDEEVEDAGTLADMRAAVEARLGPWDEAPSAMHARALKRHPDFPAWVEATAG
ncbi:MAG: hypothetical protein H6741_22580 [Alphaproteobacteria bacterium]|nr:hypothetical protein [Alphaproteobacteria bacterium]